MDQKKIQVLLVDDSLFIRQFLTNILNQDSRIEIQGTASNGIEALEFLKKNKPDVITMDINMPGIDGFETTRQIMQVNPVPIVIVSGFYNKSEVATAFKAVEAGAVTIMSRPSGPDAPDFQQSSRKFIQTIKLMAEIKVVRRYDRTLNKPQNIKPDNPPEPRQNRNSAGHSGIQIIVIGASAGGPQVLQLLIKGLQKNFPLPIMIVQHIDAGFAEGFATWLQDSSEKKITIATEGTEPEPGGIYLPPGDHHMGIGPDGKIVLTKEAAEGGIRPSVAYLFRSARRVYGNRVLAILLSGMGKDGAVELKLLKEAGSIAIAQDAASSMVHGMPGEAIRIGGASFIFSPEEIIRYMNNQIIRN